MKVTIGTPARGLQTDEATLRALGAWGAGGSLAPEIAELADDEVMAAVAVALGRPTCEVTVDTVRPDDARRAYVAVSPDVAAVVLERRGAAPELTAVTGDSVPGLVGRVVGIRPAPALTDTMPRPVDGAALDALAGGDPEPLADALAGHPAAEAVRTGAWMLWSLQVVWRDPDGEPQGRRLDVLATADDGWWELEASPSGVVVSPTTTSVVWRMLAALLPDDDEVGL